MTELVLTAIENGINLKLLLIATGLQEQEFRKYLQDDLFSSEQRKNLKEVITEWKRST